MSWFSKACRSLQHSLKKEKNIVEVHPNTNDPYAVWEDISKYQENTEVELKIPSEPVEADKIRFVCMSDTHMVEIPYKIPDGDIFIHAGDFTMISSKCEVLNFSEWLKSLPHKYKIVICGNHEINFDKSYKFTDYTRCYYEKNVKQYLTNCIYLEDSGVELYGIKIWGSPWQPEFRGGAFILPRGQKLLSKWNLIPDDTDVLITHNPPLGRGDMLRYGGRAGCVELLSTVQKRVKPKYHVFGRMHFNYGAWSDGTTTYINAATTDNGYQPINLPVVFDMPLPVGQKK